MPFLRDLRSLRFPLIHDPAFFAAGTTAAAWQRPGASLPVVAVAEFVGADPLAAKPGQQARADRHPSIPHRSSGEQRLQAGRAVIAPPAPRGKEPSNVAPLQHMVPFGEMATISIARDRDRSQI